MLIVKSYGKKSWTDKNNWNRKEKYGPMYIHFTNECLENYDSDNYNAPGESFPFSDIKVDPNNKAKLREADKVYLHNMGIN